MAPSSSALTPADKFRELRHYLSSGGIKTNIAMALPKHMDPDRMIRVCLTSISKNPLLLECSPQSLAAALVNCSEWGLEPNGRDIHLVPFKNNKTRTYEVQVIPDYKGFIKLAYQSGLVRMVMARAVRQKDDFKYKYGTGSFLHHTPSDESDRGPLVFAWAMAELKDGGEPFVVLNKSEVMAHKAKSMSAGSDFSPWRTFEDSMWAKTAVGELTKFMPLSAQMASVIDADDREMGEMQIIDTVLAGREPGDETDEPTSRSEELAAQMEG